MERAYSVLTIKAAAVEGGKRIFRGIATTITADRYGDVVEPKGAQFALPIPLLWQHDSRDPIGWVRSAKVRSDGIEVEVEVGDVDEDGELKQRLANVWQYIKSGLVRGLSIGFRPKESARIGDTYAYRYLSWEWLELSAVTIPANQEATILALKSADLAASGRDGQRRAAVLPASGGKPASTKGTGMNTPAQELAALREKRATNVTRMKELNDLVDTEARRMSAEEAAEYDELQVEVEDLDHQIRRKSLEVLNAGAATPVQKGANGAGQRSGPTILIKKQDPDDKFKGQSYTRILIAKALGRLHDVSPVAVAQKRWGQTNPKLVEHIRAAVAGGGTGSGEWASELADSDTRYTGDFVEFLYAMTIFDRLPLRPAPARVHVKGRDGEFTGYWVGESKAIPASAGNFSDVELTPLKVAALAIISKELMEDSSPSAEMLVRDGLAEASSQRVDTTFLGAAAASAGVSPAGILNGVSALVPSGTDLAAVRADLQALLYPFVQARMASGIQLIMNPATGLALSMMYGALDQPAFPDVNETGGTINRRPVWTGDNVDPGNVIALRPQDIWKIGDSGIQVSMSDTATIEQDTTPTGATDTPTGATTTNLTSMFQEESVAFKVVRRINFAKRRANCVQYLSNVEWGGVVS